MMVDKEYCMSSYLAFRFIEKDDMDFFEGMSHKRELPFIPKEKKTPVRTAEDIDRTVAGVYKSLEGKKLGIFLSGGMDSACLASYMTGCDAYTFRFLNGSYQTEELKKAEFYADYYNLNLHYVDIDWDSIMEHLDFLMKVKNEPIQAIEPQLYLASLQAKNDGIDIIITGECADIYFGGFSKLMAKDWTVEEFIQKYMFTDPYKVLKNPVNLSYVFEEYRLENDKINFIKFINEVYAKESSYSFFNPFNTAGVNVLAPYEYCHMAEPFDLKRIRGGESKYLMRELFAMKYPGVEIPEKTPMPRPVDEYFKNWQGPAREEFIENIDITQFTGNQKWQIYCLERFLNLFEV